MFLIYKGGGVKIKKKKKKKRMDWGVVKDENMK